MTKESYTDHPLTKNKNINIYINLASRSVSLWFLLKMLKLTLSKNKIKDIEIIKPKKPKFNIYSRMNDSI